MWTFVSCLFVVEGNEEEAMQARPVYVAAVDLSCKIWSSPLCLFWWFLVIVSVWFASFASLAVLNSLWRRIFALWRQSLYVYSYFNKHLWTQLQHLQFLVSFHQNELISLHCLHLVFRQVLLTSKYCYLVLHGELFLLRIFFLMFLVLLILESLSYLD